MTEADVQALYDDVNNWPGLLAPEAERILALCAAWRAQAAILDHPLKWRQWCNDRAVAEMKAQEAEIARLTALLDVCNRALDGDAEARP